MRADILRQVADAIERQHVHDQEVGLNMKAFHGAYHSCGTSACIAGFTELLVEGRSTPMPDITGAMILDLTRLETQELFYARDFDIKLTDAAHDRGEDSVPSAFNIINQSEKLVPDALRWMADTGRVDWSDALNHACQIRGGTDAVTD